MTLEIPPHGLTLILGGARSGKSAFAERQARLAGRAVTFVATATALDDDMRARIRQHRLSRPAEWRTLEAPRQVGEALSAVTPTPVVIVDCVTLWVSNILLAFPEDAPFDMVNAAVQAEIESMLTLQARWGGSWLCVSNEVGLGIVPAYALGRRYRDVLGWANQQLAQAAARVVLMVAGLPLVVK